MAIQPDKRTARERIEEQLSKRTTTSTHMIFTLLTNGDVDRQMLGDYNYLIKHLLGPETTKTETEPARTGYLLPIIKRIVQEDQPEFASLVEDVLLHFDELALSARSSVVKAFGTQLSLRTREGVYTDKYIDDVWNEAAKKAQ